MKTVKLFRGPSTDQGTPGELALDGQKWKTIELPWRENRRGVSCIPLGRYLVKMVRSPSKGLVYGVQDVPGRSHVLIHSANFAGDAALGWATELQGCIAPCTYHGKMRNPQGAMQLAGLVSKPACNSFMSALAGQPFILEIS
jgi:hypothetical protein